MFLAYLCIILGILHLGVAQSSRELDSLLQDYAFRTFVRPRTGVVYDGRAPPNFTGIDVAALRLRSGSLRRKGFDSYKEFSIPVGVIEQPYVERLVLVYQNLGNWSSLYYSLPGYTLLAPVLGLLAYDATNLSATNLSELDIWVSDRPILIRFPNLPSRPRGSSSPMCVYFSLDGSLEFNNVVMGNTCLVTNQGHFSVVVESVVAPAPSPSSGGAGTVPRTRRRGRSKRVSIIVGSVIGGAVLLVLLALLFVCVRKCLKQKKIRRMEDEAESGVPLPMTSVGYTRAPVAPETRTRPFLETEYVP